MKVLHIIDTLWLGGAQSLLKSLFENQQENKDIFLFSLRTREFNIDIGHSNIVANQSESRFSLKPLLDLKEIIKTHKIDILHCHLPRSHVFGYLLKRFFFPSIKLVLHEHGEIFERYYIYKSILKLIGAKTNLFICVSKTSENEVLRAINVPTDKTAVLYNFVNTETLIKSRHQFDRKAERTKLGISESDFTVGYAGRLFKRKGWREFVSAAYRLKGKDNLKFLMAGTGKDRTKLIKALKLSGMNEKVNYLGYIKEMSWFYSLIDCLVIPSHWEGLPIAQLEARALGIPVITSDGHGLNEIQDKSRLVFENRNSDDLADKILSLYENSSLRKTMSEIPDLSGEFFSVNTYFEKLERLYNNLS